MVAAASDKRDNMRAVETGKKDLCLGSDESTLNILVTANQVRDESSMVFGAATRGVKNTSQTCPETRAVSGIGGRALHAQIGTGPRRRSILTHTALTCIAALAVGACGNVTSEDGASVEALLAAGELDTAASKVRALIMERPNDPSLRILSGRIHLARGDGTAAIAAFERAAALGAPQSEFRRELAESFLLTGRNEQVLSMLPATLDRTRLEPALIDVRLRAMLRVPLAPPGEIFLDARHRLTEGGADAASALESMLSEQGVLADNSQHVRRAISHWACQYLPQPESDPAALYRPAWANLDEANRRVIRVGPNRDIKMPSEAARLARDGDIIEIDAGEYVGDVATWTANGLWIRASDGTVVLDSRGATSEDMGIWVIRGNDTIVDGIRFVGARGPNKNGSGIRLLAHNLWLRHSEFHDNEAGLLTFNEPGGEVIVEHSIFTENGAGDGLSHNVYIGRTDRLIFRFNYSTGSRLGHQLKSRARENYILYNRLSDELNGNSSYTLDLPEGGYAIVVGNELQQGPATVNRHMVSLGAEDSSGRDHRFVFAYNTFYNHTFPATLIRDATRAGVVLVNNVVAGAPASIDAVIVYEAGNAWSASPDLVDGSNGDYRLRPTSPLIDTGATELARADIPAVPPFEYVHPARGKARSAVWKPDPGAHEFCGWPENPVD